MGIQLPAELADLAVATGVRWPQADETAMAGTATAWRTAASNLTTLGADADVAAQSAFRAFDGDAAEAARRHWDRYVGLDGRLPAIMRACIAAADRLEHGAEQVGAAKVEIIGQLIALRLQQQAAQQAHAAGFPCATAGVNTLVAGTTTTVAQVYGQLTEAVRMESGTVVGEFPLAGQGQPQGPPGSSGPPGTLDLILDLLTETIDGAEPFDGIDDTVGGVVTDPNAVPPGSQPPTVPGMVPDPVVPPDLNTLDPDSTGPIPISGGGALAGRTVDVPAIAEPGTTEEPRGGPAGSPVRPAVPTAPTVDPVPSGATSTGPATVRPTLATAVDGPTGGLLPSRSDPISAPPPPPTVSGGGSTSGGGGGGGTGGGTVALPGAGGTAQFGGAGTRAPVGGVPIVSGGLGSGGLGSGGSGSTVAGSGGSGSAGSGSGGVGGGSAAGRPPVPVAGVPITSPPPAGPGAGPGQVGGPAAGSGPGAGGQPGAPVAEPGRTGAVPGGQVVPLDQGAKAGGLIRPAAEPAVADARAGGAKPPVAAVVGTVPSPGGAVAGGQVTGHGSPTGQGTGQGHGGAAGHGQILAPGQPSGHGHQAIPQQPDADADHTRPAGEPRRPRPGLFPGLPADAGDLVGQPRPRAGRADPEALDVFLMFLFPAGQPPVPAPTPARQLRPPPRELDLAAGLRFPPGDHPRADLVDSAETLDAIRTGREPVVPPAGLPGDSGTVRALAEGHDPLGGQHEREWARRFLVRHAMGGPAEYPVHAEYAWPPVEAFPEGASAPETAEAVVLEPGTVIDRFGEPTGVVLAAAGTPFEQRSLPPEYRWHGYHRYEVARPLPVWRVVSAAWFGQPGGGVRYRTTYPVLDLLVLGYLVDVTARAVGYAPVEPAAAAPPGGTP